MTEKKIAAKERRDRKEETIGQSVDHRLSAIGY
jgi:hypothetical protein